MAKALFLVLLMFQLTALQVMTAQNLVTDYSFEATTMDLKSGTWTNIGNGSTDLFDMTQPHLLPNHALYERIQTLKSSRYIGLILIGWKEWDCKGREFVSGQLSQPLVAGKTYQIEMWVRQPQHDYPWPVAELGVYVSPSDTFNQEQLCKVRNFIPLRRSDGGLISEHQEWEKIAGTFVAKGGERFITIGGFMGANFSALTGSYAAKGGVAYYCIDELSLSPIDAANVSTDLHEAPPQAKSLIIEETLFFDSNSANLTDDDYRQLDNLIAAIATTPNVCLDIVGHTDRIGSSSFNEALSLRRAASVQSYLQQQGIAGSRIQIRGAGYSQVINSQENEWAHQANRRVTITAMYCSAPPAFQAQILFDFAQLVAYVRYFYPVPVENFLDWNEFTAYGIHLLRQQKTEEACHKKMLELTTQIVPDLQLDADKQDEKQPQLTEGEKLFWQHKGLNTPKQSGNPAYESRLVKWNEPSTWLFEKQPAHTSIVHQGTTGNYYRIPLVNAASPKEGKRRIEQLNTLAKAMQNTPILRQDRYMANLFTIWGAVQHFYPYVSQLGIDWPSSLTTIITEGSSCSQTSDFEHFAQLLVAKLRDGHARISHTSSASNMWLPFEATWQENSLIIRESGHPLLKIGDEVLQIDGQDVMALLRSGAERISGSPQWKLAKATKEIGIGPQYSKALLKIRRNKETHAISVVRDWGDYAPLPPIRGLADEIFYVNLTQISEIDTVLSHLADMNNSRAVIFDVRGYLVCDFLPLLSHLVVAPDTALHWVRTPLYVEPNQQATDFGFSGWGIQPQNPHVGVPVYFLTDARAISASESFLAFAKHYNLGTIIGLPTAGANGSQNRLPLLENYTFYWTGMMATHLSGEDYFTKGVQPDVPLPPGSWSDQAVLDFAVGKIVLMGKNLQKK